MLPKTTLQFGEWRPDIALLDNQFSAIAENVYPAPNSYLPFPGLAPITTAALPAPAKGLTFARTTSGAYVVYAGTASNLYKWSGTAWTDVSRAVGGAYAVQDDALWSFAQFGDQLIAVHPGDEPQVADITAGTAFEALGGNPPNATSVAVVGDFLVLSGLTTNNRMIKWSGINNIEQWTVGLELSDEQEFPDSGPVVGVAGGESGFVVQDRGLRTMQFLPGQTDVIFSFSRIEREKGCMAKYGFMFTRGVLFLLAEDGFYGIGAQNPSIGDHIVNQWFHDHSDPARRHMTFAFTDPAKPHVMWAFYGSATSPIYDRIIIYDWSLNRWSYSTQAAQIWGTLASAQVDLDTDIPGDPLDPRLDSAAPSLDSHAYIGGRPVVAAIDVNSILCFLDGPALPAVIETAEGHLSQGQRTYVSSAYPLVDAAPVTVALGQRERLQDGVSWGTPAGVEITGWAVFHSSARLYRFRVQTPTGAAWTHAQGVQIEAQPDGEI